MISGKSRYSLLSLVALFLFVGFGLCLPSVQAALGVKTSSTMTNHGSGSQRESLTAAKPRTAFGAAASSFHAAPAISPATLTVTTNADSGAGSLRDVMAAASAGDTINFDVTGTITLTSGELAITQDLTINGPGADVLSISGNQASRIFNIAAGAATVSISGLTLRDGKPVGGTSGGGAMLINNGASVGTVNLTGCTITNNEVSLAGNPLGGGIDNEGGTVVIDQCAIVNNTATFRGGAIQNQGFGSMTITNSTIAGNTAGVTGIGGGIRSLLPLTLTNDTIYGNSAQTAGNLSRSGGTINFKNTIIAGGTLVGSGGTGPDISGAAGLNSQDYNLIENTAGATITGATTNNITGVSPLLGPLQNNGGHTPTMSPLAGSPVIDQGSAAFGTDQRGVTRPHDIASLTNAAGGDGSDIGAVEGRFAPTITADGPLSRQQSATGTSATIATVSDVETAADSLTVAATTVPTGITVSDITNTSGTITATVAASCAASAGSNTVVLTVTDGDGDTATANLTVNVTSGAVGISSDPSNKTVNIGQSVTFSVTTTGPVTGYQWRKGGEPINGATSDAYTINPAALSHAGSYDVVVTGPCGTATSNAATLTVNKLASSTVLASSLAPASYGQPITLTATVSSGSNTSTGTRSINQIISPTGNIQFFDGANVLGTAALNNGSASISTAALGASDHTLTAVYMGDDRFEGSTSATITQTVNQAVSQLTLTSSANPAVRKQYLTFTATVSGVNGPVVSAHTLAFKGGATVNGVNGTSAPTGTVTFKDGATVLGTATINSLGRAALSTSALSTGSHAITAEYSGNSNYLTAAASPLELSVSKGLTATTLVSSANPSSVGQPVTLTARLVGAGGAPTGRVEFFAGETSLGTAQLNGQSASLTTSALSDNVISLTAVYTGDDEFAASASPALTQVVVLYCAFNLSALTRTFALSGGNGEIQLTTRGGCEWIATSNADWITITTNGIKNNDGTVNFTVAPLTSGLARTGTMTIAGQTVTITQAKPIAVVSAASYTGLEVAPGAIVSLFGESLSAATDTTSTLPLPTTLAGTRVKVTDSQGVSRFSPLFYVSASQINYLIPADTALGAATITVVNDTEEVTGAGTIPIVPVSPSLFTANSDGQGVPAAVLFRLAGDGGQTYETISQFDVQQNKYVPLAIDLGPDTDQVFLLLFGTGVRHRTSLVGVTALIGGQEVEVLYAGPQGGFEGLDQINLSIPRSLIGAGETDLVLMVDGKVVNTVRIKIQ